VLGANQQWHTTQQQVRKSWTEKKVYYYFQIITKSIWGAEKKHGSHFSIEKNKRKFHF
jgi:hypothetical protein